MCLGGVGLGRGWMSEGPGSFFGAGGRTTGQGGREAGGADVGECYHFNKVDESK